MNITGGDFTGGINGADASFSGDVGIGTSSPLVSLHIKDPDGSDDRYGGVRFIPTDGTNYNEVQGFRGLGLRIQGSASGSSYFWNAIDLNDAGMFFQTGTGASLTEKFTILNGGNVGIGTASPASLLNVVDTGNVIGINSTVTGGGGGGGGSTYGIRTLASSSVSAYGGYSEAVITGGSGYGIYGKGTGNIGTTAYGVYGEATGAGYGYAYGVYGTASGSGFNYAGYFAGDVHITGNLYSATETAPWDKASEIYGTTDIEFLKKLEVYNKTDLPTDFYRDINETIYDTITTQKEIEVEVCDEFSEKCNIEVEIRNVTEQVEVGTEITTSWNIWEMIKLNQGSILELNNEIQTLKTENNLIKSENTLIKSELCKKDASYIWCKEVKEI